MAAGSPAEADLDGWVVLYAVGLAYGLIPAAFITIADRSAAERVPGVSGTAHCTR
ncbi:hypothetical protein [Agromyces aerolatus]|uniref:hypothetical protein n=1 Tax=Agromyces sp. LY-1074 TaxID=3074080 RepID=UPI00285B0F39|nr:MULTISPECIES: hypothetical protein [unclassified Agromyces]MDR5699669.1 hypothetical protein [Agromyces sp. LY-1074]MDR5705965.1 hypothetical protein [Agromyces sp. LY-1358]